MLKTMHLVSNIYFKKVIKPNNEIKTMCRFCYYYQSSLLPLNGFRSMVKGIKRRKKLLKISNI